MAPSPTHYLSKPGGGGGGAGACRIQGPSRAAPPWSRILGHKYLPLKLIASKALALPNLQQNYKHSYLIVRHFPHDLQNFSGAQVTKAYCGKITKYIIKLPPDTGGYCLQLQCSILCSCATCDLCNLQGKFLHTHPSVYNQHVRVLGEKGRLSELCSGVQGNPHRAEGIH